MRKYTKIILWVVVGAFVGTIFFVWGMDAGRRKSSIEKSSAAVVNGTAISYADFAQRWEQRYRQITENTNKELTAKETQEMRQELMESLIDATLLEQEFKKLKLTVTNQEVASQIASIPAFQQNGHFSNEKYLATLRYNRISPQAFEAEQANSIRLAKMSQLLRESTVVTEQDVRDFFQSRSRKIKLNYVEFHWENYLSGITIDNDAVSAYFNGHRKEFDTPEEVKASHILIRFAANATEEEKLTAKLKLDNIRADIKKGASFAEMAKKNSEDPGSKEKGGDLGYFTKGMMVKPFEEAAFKLKQGEMSDIVETPFGYHLIKRTGYHPEKKSTLASVRPEIIKRLKEEKARKKAQEAALEFMYTVKKADHLSAAAKESSISMKTSGWVKEDGELPKIKSSERILNQAFNLPLNKPSSSILAGEGVYFVEVIAEAYQPFNEKLFSLERESLLEKLKQQRGEQVTRDWLARARAEAKIVNNIAKENVKPEEQEPATPATEKNVSENPATKTK